MRKLLLAAVFLLGLSGPSDALAPAGGERGSITVSVTTVKDGDTFEIAFEGGTGMLPLTFSVRVLGINAPEMHSGCGRTESQIRALPRSQQDAARAERARLRGEERRVARLATDAAKALFASSQNRVTLTDYQHDKYGGRINARVSLADGRDFATEMLRMGHAVPYDGGARAGFCGTAR